METLERKLRNESIAYQILQTQQSIPPKDTSMQSLKDVQSSII